MSAFPKKRSTIVRWHNSFGVRAILGRIRDKFGGVRADFGRIWLVRATITWNRVNWGDSGQMLVEVGRFRAKLGCFQAIFDRSWARVGRTRPKFGRHEAILADLGRICHNCGHAWPQGGCFVPHVGQFRSGLGQFPELSAGVGPIWARCGLPSGNNLVDAWPNLANAGPHVAHAVPELIEIGPHRSRIGRLRSSFVGSVPILAGSAPKSGRRASPPAGWAERLCADALPLPRRPDDHALEPQHRAALQQVLRWVSFLFGGSIGISI